MKIFAKKDYYIAFIEIRGNSMISKDFDILQINQSDDMKDLIFLKGLVAAMNKKSKNSKKAE